MGLYASTAYLQRKGEPAQPQSLTGHDCLVSGPGRAEAIWQLRPAEGRLPQGVAIKGVLSANQPETVMGAAIHGAGIALLPDMLAAEAVACGALQRLMPGWFAEPLSLHLAYECRKYQPLGVRKLIELLAAAFEEVAPCGEPEHTAMPHAPLTVVPSSLVAQQQGHRSRDVRLPLRALRPHAAPGLFAA